VRRRIDGQALREHSDPMFLGGDPDQDLTDIPTPDHQDLHSQLNEFLEGETDEFGNDMSPRNGNSGKDIRGNFTRE
jgi:hypothetical protein